MLATVRSVCSATDPACELVEAVLRADNLIFSAPAGRFVTGDRVSVQYAGPSSVEGLKLTAEDPQPERAYGR